MTLCNPFGLAHAEHRHSREVVFLIIYAEFCFICISLLIKVTYYLKAILSSKSTTENINYTHVFKMTIKDNHEFIVFCTELFKLSGFHLNIFLYIWDTDSNKSFDSLLNPICIVVVL